MKKLICILLAVFLLLGLCACNENTQKPGDKPEELTPPDLIYGAWYPMPDMNQTPVEVFADGTCTVNGEQWNWVTKSVTEENVVLTVGEGEDQFEIEFLYLTGSIPVLAQKQVGWAIRDPELWQYMIEWYNEERDKTFTLSFYAMLQADCRIFAENGNMTVETPDGYNLKLTPGQCTVTDPEGNSTVYVPIG